MVFQLEGQVEVIVLDLVNNIFTARLSVGQQQHLPYFLSHSMKTLRERTSRATLERGKNDGISVLEACIF